ncbi:GerMN domain-containing protein [bacterium]|nr:GerMN domain-containing protein [bacterium]
MSILKKLVLIALVIGAVYCIMTVLMPSNPVEITPAPQEPQKQTEPDQPAQPVEKETVSIYFIGQNSKKEDVYKIVKRDYDEERDGKKLDFAIHELLKGPSAKESALGIYTEIPKETKLRAISNLNGKKYIDLSVDFEQGGGTDGLYKRLYQLIKTINKNTTEDVYLKIEGREVDVIGGEGIMLSQPLNSRSLDN